MRNFFAILAFCLIFILPYNVDACTCREQPNITMDMLCKAPFASHVRIIDRFPKETQNPGDPDGIIKYTVTHVTVYKAPTNIKPGQWVDESKGYMVTHAQDGMCGVTNLAIGNELVVIGDQSSFGSPIGDGIPLPDNTFSIYLCGKNPYWNTLPETERQILAEFKKAGENCACGRQI